MKVTAEFCAGGRIPTRRQLCAKTGSAMTQKWGENEAGKKMERTKEKGKQLIYSRRSNEGVPERNHRRATKPPTPEDEKGALGGQLQITRRTSGASLQAEGKAGRRGCQARCRGAALISHPEPHSDHCFQTQSPALENRAPYLSQ